MLSRHGLALLFGAWVAGVEGLDAYSSSDFIRRTGHAVAVIGKRLYINGGEIAQYYNGKTISQATVQVNDTLSIPLDSAWTNRSVSITTISDSAPPFDEAALWTDEASRSMYMWGGQGPWGNLSKTKDLWKYSTDDESWAIQPAANVDVFMSLSRGSQAARTQCNGVGFYVGGTGSIWTDPAFAVGSLSVPIPGMLTYNLTSGVWANESTTALNSFATLVDGHAACLPSFGTSGKGMLLTVGGEIARRTGYNSSEPNLIGFGNMTFWDMETKTWFSQATSGDVPSPRSKFCTADLQGQNGTHEIFLFGGYDASNQASYQDIYVLSVPGFVWFKANVTTGGPRVSQQCVVAGNRQMIVVGGKNPDLAYFPGYRDVDPWTNGINVLDISSLSWNTEFDPSAATYESPAAVTDWYNAGHQDDVTWTSNTVKSLFISDATNGGSSSGNNSSSPGDNSTSSAGHSSVPVGAIVGAVIGGIVVGALAGLMFWCFRQRQRRQNNVPSEPPGYPYHSSPPGLYDPHQSEKVQELPSSEQAVMLSNEERPSELYANQWPQQEASYRHHQADHGNLHEMG